MRDDLLEARAVIHWAESDLPNLQGRIDDWKNGTPHRVFRDVNSQPGQHLFRLRDVKPIPLVLCAHAGMIIHGIRSSLDLLAVALAERNSHPSPENVYFSISQSEIAFRAPKGGLKQIKGLAASDIAIIESLKPWKGGNDLLFELHSLDKKRKHRHLLSAFAVPDMIIVDPISHSGGLKFTPLWPGFYEDAVIAQIPADAAQGDFYLTLEIRLAEPGTTSTVGVIKALYDFASLAKSIIERFDTP